MNSLRAVILFALFYPGLCQFCGNRPFHRTQVGSSKVQIVTDGPVSLTSDFFVTVPAAAVRRSYRAAFRSVDSGVLQMNVLFIETSTNRVLIDTGAFNTNGIFANAGRLFSSLRRSGVDPHSIDTIILTHGHVDHCSGLLDREGNAAFKNATVYVGRVEHEFWFSDPFPEVPRGLDQETLASFGSAYLVAIKPYLDAGRVVFVEDGESPVPGMKFIFTPGHSPGHMAIEVSSEGETLLVTGDAWISKADQVQNPEWGFAPEIGFDLAYESRLKLLTRAARRRERVLCYHEQFPGLGFVQKVGAAFDWVPEAGLTFGGEVCEK